jgi:hypothetical protein
MRRVLNPFLLFLSLAALLGAPFLIISSGAEAADVAEYPGKFKVISSLDSYSSEHTAYGNFTYTPAVYADSNRTFGSPKMEGLGAAQLSFAWPTGEYGGDRLLYNFVTNGSNSLYKVHTISFAFRGNQSGYVMAGILADAKNATGVVVNTVSRDLPLDGNWYQVVLENLFHPSASYYELTIDLGTISIGRHVGAYGSGNLTIDYTTAISPPCAVRFSFFNLYSGLGLNSEILIPEVFYEGQWTRVWNNEIVIAAGETIAYRVHDYFDRTIEFVPYLVLDDTTVYLDVTVPLVTVYVSKPDFYNSTLPPEWTITYLTNGNSIAATGWELELIAGWYHFAWDTTEIVENGSRDVYIDGNASAARAYAMTDFSMVMNPTYSGKAGFAGDWVLPSFLTWDGFWKLVEAMYNSKEFKLASVAGVAVAIALYAYRLKQAAEDKVEDSR